MSSCDAIGLWYLAIPPWPLSTLREDWSGEHGVLSNFRISQTNCPPSSICWLHLYWLQWELGYSALNRPLPCRWSCFVWSPTTNAHIKGKKKPKQCSYGVTQSCSQQLHFWFCHWNEIILHTSPGRSQRSLPLLDLYKLHILLCRNLFRGATDPKHRFFVIDTTALHWAHDLTTAFSVSQQNLWC